MKNKLKIIEQNNIKIEPVQVEIQNPIEFGFLLGIGLG